MQLIQSIHSSLINGFVDLCSQTKSSITPFATQMMYSVKNIGIKAKTLCEGRIKPLKEKGTVGSKVYTLAYRLARLAFYTALVTIPRQEEPLDSFAEFERKYSLAECEKRVATAKNLFLSCPAAEAFWNQLEKRGPFTIACVDPEKIPGGADLSLKARLISISRYKSDVFKYLFIELSNLNSAEKSIEITENRCTLFNSADAYAEAVERDEYEDMKRSNELSKVCIEGGYWPPERELFGEQFGGNSSETNWTTVAGYLQNQEEFGHTNLYRRQWLKKCK